MYNKACEVDVDLQNVLLSLGLPEVVEVDAPIWEILIPTSVYVISSQQ